MPTLDWIGKDKVINHHQDVPYRVLEKQYTYNSEDSENMVIHGDNLEVLKSLLPKYEGRVNCIYIDPPYNTGKEGWVYNDNVNDPKIKKWLGEVVGKEGEDFSRHDKWLSMMYPRLKLLHRLLADDGVIFISLDFINECAHLRCICNEIFNPNNFLGELTWESTTQPDNSGSAKFSLQQKTEPIFVYCKNKMTKASFILQQVPVKKNYTHKGKLGFCRLENLEKSDSGDYNRPTMKFPILGQSPRKGKRWQIGLEAARELEAKNRIEIVNGIIKKAVYPEDEIDKIKFYPFWSHLSAKEVGTSQTGKAILNDIMERPVGFDTVKPPKLIESLLSHFRDDIIVLDSFAGSGTTAHAVLNLNKRDGGNRKFILIEMMDYAESITAERVKHVIDGYKTSKNEIIYDKAITAKNLADGSDILREANEAAENAKERYSTVNKPKIIDGRLQVIAKQKEADTVEGTGGDFSFYELGEPLLIDENLNNNVDTAKIREYVWYMETKKPLTENGNDYYLGTSNNNAYYFYYDKKKITTLNNKFLSKIKIKADSYTIYAEKCALSAEFLAEHNIIFKKIPRDISKL